MFLCLHQLCIWYISVDEGQVITLSFKNFSLETQEVCQFDYVEVHDSLDTGAGKVLGRWVSIVSCYDTVTQMH